MFRNFLQGAVKAYTVYCWYEPTYDDKNMIQFSENFKIVVKNNMKINK